MFCYASRTGTKRNLDALRRHGWGLMISRAGVWRTENFTRIGIDNGAWSDFQAGRQFDQNEYERFLDWMDQTAVIPDWIVLPDIVAGGMKSLELSVRYINRCRSISSLVLIAVQDGMQVDDLAPLVGEHIGIFMGGSTEWKLERMIEWGVFCARQKVYYHVARVNTAKRIHLAIAAGAHSVDGSNLSRYSINAPRLTNASQHRDLFNPCEQFHVAK